jgi:ribosome-associated translation inhibitor RaiA
MIQVENEIRTYDHEIEVNPKPKVIVKNHWSQRGMVKLSIFAADEALEVTVSASDLKAAIDNAINVNRY